jgi:hypothetical protein
VAPLAAQLAERPAGPTGASACGSASSARTASACPAASRSRSSAWRARCAPRATHPGPGSVRRPAPRRVGHPARQLHPHRRQRVGRADRPRPVRAAAPHPGGARRGLRRAARARADGAGPEHDRLPPQAHPAGGHVPRRRAPSPRTRPLARAALAGGPPRRPGGGLRRGRGPRLEFLGGTYEHLFNGIEVDRFAEAEPWPSDRAHHLLPRAPRAPQGPRRAARGPAAAAPDVTIWIGSDGPDTERLKVAHAGDPRLVWLGRLSDEEKRRRLRRRPTSSARRRCAASRSAWCSSRPCRPVRPSSRRTSPATGSWPGPIATRSSCHPAMPRRSRTPSAGCSPTRPWAELVASGGCALTVLDGPARRALPRALRAGVDPSAEATGWRPARAPRRGTSGRR